MKINGIDALWRRRIARELDIYRCKAHLSFDDLASQIMREVNIVAPTRAGADYKPLSGRSLRGFVLGNRSTHRRVAGAARDFLSTKIPFPTKNGLDLLFDISPSVLDLASRQAQFFGVNNLPRSHVKSFSGVYRIDRVHLGQKIFVYIDYLDETKTLLCRGYMHQLIHPHKREYQAIFLSGFAVASPKSLSIFMTDHQTPQAYIIDLNIDEYNSSITAQHFFIENEVRFSIVESLNGNNILSDAKDSYYIIGEGLMLGFFPFCHDPKRIIYFSRNDIIDWQFQDIFSGSPYLYDPEETEQFKLLEEYYNKCIAYIDSNRSVNSEIFESLQEIYYNIFSFMK